MNNTQNKHTKGTYRTIRRKCNDKQIGGNKQRRKQKDQPPEQTASIPRKVFRNPKQHVQVLVLSEVLKHHTTGSHLAIVVFQQRRFAGNNYVERQQHDVVHKQPHKGHGQNQGTNVGAFDGDGGFFGVFVIVCFSSHPTIMK